MYLFLTFAAIIVMSGAFSSDDIAIQLAMNLINPLINLFISLYADNCVAFAVRAVL